MIIIALGLIGAFLGFRNARKQGGTRADMAQYAVAAGIAGMLVGLVVTVVIERVAI